MESKQFYTSLLCQNVGPYSIRVSDINKMYLILFFLLFIFIIL
jgi:hypothetical protein